MFYAIICDWCFQVCFCIKLVWVRQLDRDWVERLPGLAHLALKPVRNRNRPRRHHLPESWTTGAFANPFLVTHGLGFWQKENEMLLLNFSTEFLKIWYYCVYFLALHAASASPGSGGGDWYSSGIFGAASLQTWVMALRQDAQVAPLTACNAAMICLVKLRSKEFWFCFCVFRLDFDYLNEIPVLVLDVSDDFKSDRIKQEEIIDKVGEVFSFLAFLLCVHSLLIVSYVSLCRSESFSRRFDFNYQSQQASRTTSQQPVPPQYCLCVFRCYYIFLLYRYLF